MNKSKTQLDIAKIIIKQLKNFWCISFKEKRMIDGEIQNAFDKYYIIANASKNKYFKDAKFSIYHSDQYAILLYLLGHCLIKRSLELAEKLYYLNKVMHSIDLYPEVKLPNIFCFFHPVGTVIGRANYNDYFTISQNCTVGNNKGLYPTMGRLVSLMAGSMVLGSSTIGNNCIISTGTIVKDQVVPENSIVFGVSPNIIIKPNNIKSSYWVLDA